jgi:hypothetical protein
MGRTAKGGRGVGGRSCVCARPPKPRTLGTGRRENPRQSGPSTRPDPSVSRGTNGGRSARRPCVAARHTCCTLRKRGRRAAIACAPRRDLALLQGVSSVRRGRDRPARGRSEGGDSDKIVRGKLFLAGLCRERDPATRGAALRRVFVHERKKSSYRLSELRRLSAERCLFQSILGVPPGALRGDGTRRSLAPTGAPSVLRRAAWCSRCLHRRPLSPGVSQRSRGSEGR